LQAAVGVLLGNGDNQAQVGLDHFLLRATGLGFANRHLAVDFLDLVDRQIGNLLDVFQTFLVAQDFFLAGFQGFCVFFTRFQVVVDPAEIGLVRLEGLDKCFTRHFRLVYTDIENRPFIAANAIDDVLEVGREPVDKQG